MILFNLLINFAEALCYTLFLAYYFSIRNKRLYVGLSTAGVYSLLNYAQFMVTDNGLWLSILACLFLIGLLIIWEKKFSFEYIYITVLYHIFIIMCTYLSFYIVSQLISFITLNDNQYHICFCTLAKFFQSIFTLYLIKKEVRLTPLLDLKKWKSILIIDLILLISIVTTAYAIVQNNISGIIIQFILAGEFVIAILFRITINQISILNQNYVKKLKKEEQYKYIQKQLLIMKNIKNEISATDHRINYMLLQLKTYLQQNKLSEMEDFLERYTNIMFKYKLVCDTGNVVFDCFISLKINEMIMNQILVESSFYIQKDDAFNDMQFIKMTTELLEFFKNCQSIYVSMQSFGSYLDIRIIYRDGNINADQLYIFLKNNFPDKTDFLSNDYARKGVHLVINMEKYYGIYNYELSD